MLLCFSFKIVAFTILNGASVLSMSNDAMLLQVLVKEFSPVVRLVPFVPIAFDRLDSLFFCEGYPEWVSEIVF
jgi:hypothetical protein